jgi:hypothetical protein
MESKRPIVQANNKLAAAQTLLDRVGVSKVDKIDVNHNMNSGGIFLMPDKAPLDLEETEDGDYEVVSND